MHVNIRIVKIYSLLVFIGIIIGGAGSWLLFYKNIKPVTLPAVPVIQSGSLLVSGYYKIPFVGNGLNLSYYFAQAMKNSNLPDEIGSPTYRYMRALMYDMFVSYPGRDDFVDCIKNPNFIVDPQNTDLDISWLKACSMAVPQDSIFSANNLDILERYRLQLYYLSFRKEDPSYCEKLLTVKILTDSIIVESDELESYTICKAAAQRKDYAIHAAYFRMTQAIEKNQCENLSDSSMMKLCTKHISIKNNDSLN